MTKKRDPDLEDFDDEEEDEGSSTKTEKPTISHLSYEEAIKQLTATEAKANQHWETVLRTQAEMENIRRRNEQSLTQAHKYALEKIARELLPVVDNLERGLTQMGDEEETSALRTGVELTLKQLQGVLEKFAIKPVEPAVGSSFDPTLQEAMTTRDSDEPAGTILEVLQKGYQLNDRLLRPALVVVAKSN